MRRHWRILLPILAVFIFIVVMVGGYLFNKNVKTIIYSSKDGYMTNPLMGFAPNADYVEAVGDSSLVYVDITFREWEPEQGVFDVEGVQEENHLERWKAEGKNVVLRFVCDIPDDEEHLDIPDWLYDRLDAKEFYDTDYGKGYSPDYTDPIFIEEHRKAILALGEAFGGDDFVAYVELGSLGHWGEWHVKYNQGIKRFPGGEVCLEYVKPYVEAFPNAKLLVRRPFDFVDTYDMGIFNDMTGAEEDTADWLTWIRKGGVYDEAETPLTLKACDGIWNRSPIGGEFTSRYSMEEMLTDRLEETLALLEKTHMTFIGPNCPIANREFITIPEGVEAVLQKVGYRFGVSKTTFRRNILTGKVSVEITIHNDGVAAFYRKWPVVLYELSESGTVVRKLSTELDLRDVPAKGTKSVTVSLGTYERLEDVPNYALVIENPNTGEPGICLDNTLDKQVVIGLTASEE